VALGGSPRRLVVRLAKAVRVKEDIDDGARVDVEVDLLG
jgi:hypothetical protein